MMNVSIPTGKSGAFPVPAGATVTSLAPTVATAVVQGTMLTITAVKVGTASIKIGWPPGAVVSLLVTITP